MAESTLRTPTLTLPSHPVLYEINTWVWLNDLSHKYGRRVTLTNVPDAEWDAVGALNFDAVWLMGVWQRSPAGRAIALHNDALLADFRAVLPDFDPSDVVGSPYCIRNYVVDDALGGREGLVAARRALAERGMGLLLDFVPNHVAPDHPWTESHPEYFIQGTAQELAHAPDEYLRVGNNIYARGRDPYFAPWQDVVQLNAFAPGLRQQMIATLLDIASQCDGVRCDMAMLMNTAIFTQTWGERAGSPPKTEYWSEIIAAVTQQCPQFTWIAEVYWDMEWQMQQLGFACCYDKRLYDRLAASDLGARGTVEAVRAHLRADTTYQNGLVRFVENHDEPRAAALFAPERLRAVTLTATAQAGARLFHEGQLEGRRVKVPVFLGRRPQEYADATWVAWAQRLVTALHNPCFHNGMWQLCAITGSAADNDAADNDADNLIAWCWQEETRGTMALGVVNLGDRPTQAHIRLPHAQSAGAWQFTDVLAPQSTPLTVDSASAATMGAALALAPWAAHLWIQEPS